ncbi:MULTISPECIES: GIY-YIG nuclease family protein [Actinocorallia]|uniref:Bacteriophage T5 Orf172 DNA-binding domain-containing protein n=2 Tax=Actinocorallia TaxID=58108 RepID=A0ABN3UUA1_9ACTN
MSGHIYVIEFSEGTTKVGFSTKPERRLNQHASGVAGFGIRIAQSWVSEAFDSAHQAEMVLISWCALNCAGHRRSEYFTGIDFTGAVEWAKGLTSMSPGLLVSLQQHVRKQVRQRAIARARLANTFPAGEFR